MKRSSHHISDAKCIITTCNQTSLTRFVEVQRYVELLLCHNAEATVSLKTGKWSIKVCKLFVPICNVNGMNAR